MKLVRYGEKVNLKKNKLILKKNKNHNLIIFCVHALCVNILQCNFVSNPGWTKSLRLDFILTLYVTMAVVSTTLVQYEQQSLFRIGNDFNALKPGA